MQPAVPSSMDICISCEELQVALDVMVKQVQVFVNTKVAWSQCPIPLLGDLKVKLETVCIP